MAKVQSGRASHDLLTLVEHAEAVLAEMIVSGDLAPGARIYPDEFARKLGMSSIPVREALRGLAARGLVEAVARRGFLVRAADAADFAETYELRLLLDPYAARLAVPLLDSAAISGIDEALERLEQTIVTGRDLSYYRDHRDYHFAIYKHCGSRWLLEILSMLWENSRRYQRLSTGPRGTPEERVAEHRALAQACASGDAELVARLTEQHLERTRALVVPLLEGKEHT